MPDGYGVGYDVSCLSLSDSVWLSMTPCGCGINISHEICKGFGMYNFPTIYSLKKIIPQIEITDAISRLQDTALWIVVIALVGVCLIYQLI